VKERDVENVMILVLNDLHWSLRWGLGADRGLYHLCWRD